MSESHHDPSTTAVDIPGDFPVQDDPAPEPEPIPKDPDLPFDLALDTKALELEAMFRSAGEGGFTVREIMSFVFQCLYGVVMLAKLYTQIPEAEKETKTIAAVERVYIRLNPNIPWLSETLERGVARFIFGSVAPEFYRFLVKIL